MRNEGLQLCLIRKSKDNYDVHVLQMFFKLSENDISDVRHAEYK